MTTKKSDKQVQKIFIRMLNEGKMSQEDYADQFIDWLDDAKHELRTSEYSDIANAVKKFKIDVDDHDRKIMEIIEKMSPVDFKKFQKAMDNWF